VTFYQQPPPPISTTEPAISSVFKDFTLEPRGIAVAVLSWPANSLLLLMNSRIEKLVNALAPTRGIVSDQLSLFPQTELYCLPAITPKPIRLPKSITVIGVDEELSQYLSRVAAAAMVAATKACGSPKKAALRLGTADDLPDERELPPAPKTSLRLASNNS
jgi:hypothetical protein